MLQRCNASVPGVMPQLRMTRLSVVVAANTHELNYFYHVVCKNIVWLVCEKCGLKMRKEFFPQLLLKCFL